MTKLRDEILAEVRPMLAAVAAVAAGKVRAALPQISDHPEDFRGDVSLNLQAAFRQELTKALDVEAESLAFEGLSEGLEDLGPLDLKACTTKLEREYYRGFNQGIREVRALLRKMGAQSA